MCVIIKNSMQTENRRTPLHAVHTPPWKILMPGLIEISITTVAGLLGTDGLTRFVANLPKLMTSPPNVVIAVAAALALLPALQKAMYSTSFGRRTVQ